MSESIQQTRRPTLDDVAGVAGVSKAAASMALRDHPRIGTATTDRVKAAAEELGYVRNAAGQALREQRAGAIAVVVPNTSQHVFGHSYFMHLLEGINEIANERDSVVMISTNPDQQHGVAAYERILRSRRSDGAVIASAAIDDPYVTRMVDSGFPIVVIGEVATALEASSIVLPDRTAAAALCRHLVDEHGHRRIAHISGPIAHQTGRDRLDGYRDVVGSKASELVREGTYDEESGADVMSSLLDDKVQFTALFCANDEMAFGALQVAKGRGLSVPDDLAIVGFDDFGLARVVEPPLTTIRVPAKTTGRMAAQFLFDAIDGKPARHVVVDVDMVVRQSCGCSTEQIIRLKPEPTEEGTTK